LDILCNFYFPLYHVVHNHINKKKHHALARDQPHKQGISKLQENYAYVIPSPTNELYNVCIPSRAFMS
jgi:hypothetical protein